MNQQFEDIFSDAKRQSLTETERVLMRNKLLSHIAENPAKAPFSILLWDALANIVDAFGPQSRTSMRFVPATLAMVFVVGLGTAYAAEGSLPGDTLYPLKVGVSEPIKGAFAVSDAARAAWNTERLEKRLVEAEVLVASGKLTPVAQAQLENQIHATAAAFETNVEELAATKGEAAVAAAQSDLEASLIGHAEVLVALTVPPSDSSLAAAVAEEADIGIQPIIRSVLAKAEAAQAARVSNEARVASKRDGKTRAAALEKKEHAVEAVNAVRAKASGPLIMGTTTAEVAAESAFAAEQVIEQAEEKFRDGDYGSAFTAFQEAIRSVKTVEVHIDASERLNTDVKIFTRARTETPDAALMMTAEPAREESE